MEIRSISKAMRLIEAIGEDRRSHGVTDLARRLHMDKASVSRILKTLQQGGLVAQDKTTREYTLGLAFVHLGQKALRRIDLRSAAQSELETLADATGECAQLAVSVGDRALYIAQAAPPRGANIDAPLGTLVPLHCTALGKVLLAFQRDSLREEMLSRIEMEPYTEQSINDVDTLKAHLEGVRERGVAFDDEEFSIGVRCLAAPVFKHDGTLAGALGISGPSPRIADARVCAFEEIVHCAATGLSRKIGWDSSEISLALPA